MERKIRVAVIGYGNTGKATVETIRREADMELAGVVRRETSIGEMHGELFGVPVVSNVDKLGDVDVAILCLPTRMMPQAAVGLLQKGIAVVDSYDIHGGISDYRKQLGAVARAHGVAAVIAAGWDPGSDSVIRAWLLAAAPFGVTYTNFGPGMSMGHSVAARAVPGVKNALSMTMPAGAGLHNRVVYIELEDGADAGKTIAALKADEYFAHDNTHVTVVESVEAYRDAGHGVLITRQGGSGTANGQRFSFEMRIDNPALTAAIMVACARAALRQQPGCYTTIELPPVDLLPGERENWIGKLV